MRSEIMLALEQRVRNELIRHRLLAASRREASARGAALRQESAMLKRPVRIDFIAGVADDEGPSIRSPSLFDVKSIG